VKKLGSPGDLSYIYPVNELQTIKLILNKNQGYVK